MYHLNNNHKNHDGSDNYRSSRNSRNGNTTAIINGRRVELGHGISGRELNRLVCGDQKGRKGIIKKSGAEGFSRINPDRYYSGSDLTDFRGRPVKIENLPDRSKGATSFGGRRSEFSRQLITEQVCDVAAKCFHQDIAFDEDNANWFVVPEYRLPANWGGETTPLMIVFPDQYPELPPVGFYLKADLSESPNGHLFDRAYHEAWKEPLAYGWKWYCVYVEPGAWRPAYVRRPGDWRYGDNLWSYISLINEVLSGMDD